MTKEECLNFIKNNELIDTLIEVQIIKKNDDLSHSEIVFSDNATLYFNTAISAYNGLNHDWYIPIIKKFEEYNNQDYTIYIRLTYFPDKKNINHYIKSGTTVINFEEANFTLLKKICISEKACLNSILDIIINEYKERE